MSTKRAHPMVRSQSQPAAISVSNPAVYQCAKGQLVDCGYSPDGQFRAVASNTDVKIVNLKTAKETNLGIVPKGIITGAVYSPDSKKLLIGDSLETPGTIRERSTFTFFVHIYDPALMQDQILPGLKVVWAEKLAPMKWRDDGIVILLGAVAEYQGQY